MTTFPIQIILQKIPKTISRLKKVTSDAVDEVVDDDDLEVLLQELDNAVRPDVAAATGHQNRFARSGHDHVVRFLEKQNN